MMGIPPSNLNAPERFRMSCPILIYLSWALYNNAAASVTLFWGLSTVCF
jgi:hypothetical protein